MDKRVRFDCNVQIHNMHVWTFAYREARKGSNWISNILDSMRFELRKQILEEELTKIEFFSRKCYRFDLRKQKLEALLTKVGFLK